MGNAMTWAWTRTKAREERRIARMQELAEMENRNRDLKEKVREFQKVLQKWADQKNEARDDR